MTSQASEDLQARRRRRRLTNDIKESLRELSVQLSLLNHRVSARVDLKDIDLECLDMIGRFGPLTPTSLARRSGLHPATMTGVLDRLERAGWIARERDAQDRRAVKLKIRKERSGEIFRLYAGMNSSLDEICAGYGEAELEVLADFLARTSRAGHAATEDLMERGNGPSQPHLKDRD
jgi:DNA-binding MarR family transcriptional regulator